jgi:hypothetical protein
MAETWEVVTSDYILLENIRCIGVDDSGCRVRYTALENAAVHLNTDSRQTPLKPKKDDPVLVVGNTVHVPKERQKQR